MLAEEKVEMANMTVMGSILKKRQ